MLVTSNMVAPESKAVPQGIGHLALKKIKARYPDVVEVRDAISDIEVQVTEADWRGAVCLNPSACGISRAFLRNGIRALTTKSVVYLIFGTTAVRYILSRKAKRTVNFFDKKVPLGTTTLTGHAPSEATQLGPMRTACKHCDKPRNEHNVTTGHTFEGLPIKRGARGAKTRLHDPRSRKFPLHPSKRELRALAASAR